MEDCSCSQRQGRVSEGSLEIFAAVRSRCPALHRIFVPDEVWPSFQQWHRQPDLIARHRSILLLAMERDHLGRATSAGHRYLMTAGLPRSDVRQQYLRDLRERWMLYPDPIERHQKSRMFLGRLVELQCAEWLELQGWTVSGLEALREGPDIDASTQCWVELGRWHRACHREIRPTCGAHKEESTREARNETWAEKHTGSRLVRSLCGSCACSL